MLPMKKKIGEVQVLWDETVTRSGVQSLVRYFFYSRSLVRALANFVVLAPPPAWPPANSDSARGTHLIPPQQHQPPSPKDVKLPGSGHQILYLAGLVLLS